MCIRDRLKTLPESGAGSVKIQGTKNAITITADKYLMLYGRYGDSDDRIYRHVGYTYNGQEYYGYVLENVIVECEAPNPGTAAPGGNPSGPGENPSGPGENPSGPGEVTPEV